LSLGGLPAEVSLDDLRIRRPAYASRNPRIARVLAELGVMRDQGEGIPRMFEEMEVAFLPVPALDVISGRFCVVLRKEPIFASVDPSWPQAVRALPISLPQKRALVGLVGGEFANADYCALNGVDRNTAYRELHELVDRGLLVMTGSGAGARYRVVRAAAPPARPATPLEALEVKMSELGYVSFETGNGATRGTGQALDGPRVDCRKICRVCLNLRLMACDR